MLLDRFDEFVVRVKSSQALLSHANSVFVYRYFERSWFDESNKRISISGEPNLIENLAKARAENEFFKPRKGREVFFKIGEIDSVVQADFITRPREPRINKYSAELRDCFDNATAAYKSKHDSLTGLLNRDGFYEKSSQLIDRAVDGRSAVTAMNESSISTPAVHVISFDLDHFKQVNDTYGHNYGDIVLQSFAQRISILSSKFREKYQGRAAIEIARFGGEEFNLFISGQLSKQDIEEIADEYRKEISNNFLPTDEEFGKFAKDSQSGIKLPLEKERSLTVSVGLASRSLPSIKIDNDSYINELVGESDVAMYRAKANGRNAVCHFDHILAKYGRILEHHADTGIVAIDIGKNVKTPIGQEFIVFHPDFSGKKPFVYSDGRTNRQLGVYPKHACGRIVTFDVQQDISFCKELDDSGIAKSSSGEYRNKAKFLPGSIVEMVPLGSISHLLHSGLKAVWGGGASDLLPIKALQDEVKKNVAENKEPVAFVFAVKHLEEIYKQKGSATVNLVLAKMYEAIHEVFKTKSIGKVQETELAVLEAGISREDAVNKAKNVAEQVKNTFRGEIEILVGIAARYDGEGMEQFSYIPDYTLEVAQYALLEAMRPDQGNIILSSETTFSNILINLRNQGKNESASVDFDRMISFGMDFSALWNQGAIIYAQLENPNFEKALELIDKAIKAAKGMDVWFRFNKGVILLGLERYEESYQEFEIGKKIMPTGSDVLGGVYLSVYAYAMYKSYELKNVVIKKEMVESALSEAIKSNVFIRPLSKSIIQSALEAVQGQ